MTPETSAAANQEPITVVEPKPEVKGAARPIVYFPDSKLSEASKWVKLDADYVIYAPWGMTGLKALVDDLVATMVANDGVGLSAIQVGVPLRVFVVANGAEPLVFINPTWKPAGTAETVADEGCLSFPGVFEPVKRFTYVEATSQAEDATLVVREYSDVQARVIQHETEHLDGHLLIEHLPITKRETVRTKMKQRARLTKRVGKVLGLKGDDQFQALLRSGLVKASGRPGFRR